MLEIIAHFEQFVYLPGNRFAFDASSDVINYVTAELTSNAGKLALLHETSHAILGHFHFSSDLELFMMELSAWRHTATLAEQFAIDIDRAYIDDCIDSYERWLDQRSTCPTCANFCLSDQAHHYHCFVCATEWDIATDRDSTVIQTITKAPIS